MRLIEPLGLLHGRAARHAVEAGFAAPLAGGPSAFTAIRLHDGAASGGPFPVRDVPADWRDVMAVVTRAPPRWAGLAVDRPLIMGIVNVTPDSFSDGGRHATHDDAIAHGRRLAAEGADILDVGGESTRPGAAETPAQAEQERILPVIRALAAEGFVVSVDTRHAGTMRAAREAGAAVVNDVSGLSFDPAAAELMRGDDCPVVIQHMRGTPETMVDLAQYADVAVETTRELAERIAGSGIAPARVLADPGIGFAKLPHHNLEILARLPILANLGCRILIGASRKGFLGQIGAEPEPARRLPGSLATAIAAVLGGASMVRVHDVAETAQALRVWQAIIDSA